MILTLSKSSIQFIVAHLLIFWLKCIDQAHGEFNENLLGIPYSLSDVNAEINTAGDSKRDDVFSRRNLDKVSDVLTKLLLIPWPRGESPLIYIEKPETSRDYVENELPTSDYDLNVVPDDDVFKSASSKRSKYYRKYPWKRQQNSPKYEPSYLCMPNKADIFKLLVAIHEERNGSKGQLVDFCNRKRPASLVFTNMLYLG